MSTNFNLTPPCDLEAEKSLLGMILLNNKILDEIADKTKPEYFYDFKHQLLYQLFLELWSQNKPVDILSVLNSLENSKFKEKLKDDSIDKVFLLDLLAKSSLSTSSDFISQVLKDKYLLRTLITVSDEIKTLAVKNEDNPLQLLDIAQKRLYEVSVDSIEKTFISLSDILDTSFQRISNLYEKKDDYSGLPTGFIELDKILGGLHNSDLIILAARPSMGKTSLVMEIVKRASLNQHAGIAVFSLEMSSEQIVDRLIASVSKVDLWKIKTGKFVNEYGKSDDDEFFKIGDAIGKLGDANIWIDDSGSLNVLELRTKARRLKSRHNIDLIVIDYLQLMSGRGDRGYQNSRVQEVADISRSLKMLAKELNVPILALSQLSRSVETRDDKRPILSDLRESGSIEQDADVVMFIHRKEMYERDLPEDEKGRADIIIAKHRNGQTGSTQLAWIHHLATFDNLDGAKIKRRVE